MIDPELNKMLEETSSGCLAELIRFIFVTPFKILSDIFRYKGSLIIWPLPLILIIACLVTQQYAGMIAIIIFAVIITYISKWITDMVKWQRKSPLERELDKITDKARRKVINQEKYMMLREHAILSKSPGSIDKLNSMKSHNLISEEEYMSLRLVMEPPSQQSR
jgi:hypothetical protein